MRLAVLADLHGHAGALRTALADVRRRGVDRLVLLGDLLGYGCEVEATLDLVRDALDRDRALLVLGNHDAFQLDPATIPPELPAWIAESTAWTAERLARSGLAAAFRGLPWQARIELDGVLLAHANPFPQGADGAPDWAYLRQVADLRRAGAALVQEGLRTGIFGHTHRPLLARIDRDGELHAGPVDLRLDAAALLAVGAVIANPGALGQPRGAPPGWLLLDQTEGGIALRRYEPAVDHGPHLGALAASGLSPATRARLAAFFTGSPHAPGERTSR